jgi:uncharacterized membrane protein YdbT with pleckstrin-like domain
MEVWQNEVIEDAAIFKAIRPSLTAPPSALSLYDSATQGLTSLAGEPTAKDVDKFKAWVAKPDTKELERLRAEKVALDKKTDDLEKKAADEREARLKAEAAKKASDEAAEKAAIQARKAESVSKLTTVGAVAAGVGVLALLFGSFLNISKLTAGLVIAAGIGISVAAPWLIDLAEMKWVIVGLLAFLGTDVVVFVAIKTWRYLRRETPQP